MEPVAGEILYHNRKPAADTAYRYVADAIDFARQSDVIIVATSGGPEVTRGFVISTVPEPSSLVLSLLGFSALIGFRAWSARKRRLQAN